MNLKCENEGCEEEATTRYRWPWGAEGFVCETHLAAVKMQAVNLAQQPEYSHKPADDDDDDDASVIE